MKIGIDLGGSHIAVGIVSDEGNIIAKQQKNIIYTNQNEDEIKGLIRDSILSLINDLKNSLHMPIFVIEKMGIGIPGTVEENKVISCKKYGISNWDIAKELEEFYQIEVKVYNDAICSAKCEKGYGSLKDCKKSVFLCYGTGIGGATIINENICESEYGHMIIEKDGNECYCGKKGCYETYASMKVFKEGIIKLLGLNEKTTSEELVTILNNKKDDPEVVKYINEYLDSVIIGISNVINMIHPEKICLGGSITYYKDILLERLQYKVKKQTYQFKAPEIVFAKYENDAGIIGATI